MVWPGSGKLRGRWAGSAQLMCTRGTGPRMPLTQPGFRGAWKEKQQLGARRDLGSDSQSHRKGTCRVRRWMLLEHPALQGGARGGDSRLECLRFVLGMLDHRDCQRGWCQKGSLIRRSRAGKRQSHRTVQVTCATPGSQDVPLGQRVLCLKT